MSRGFGTLVTGLVAFAGGVVAGMLLTPRSGKENRKWIENTSHKIIEDSEKRLGKVSSNIKRSMKDNLPDLYEATEDLLFEDEELEGNE